MQYIDAVCIATPDHWHAFMSVHAAKAKKDITAKTPLSVDQGGTSHVHAHPQTGVSDRSMQRSSEEFRVAELGTQWDHWAHHSGGGRRRRPGQTLRSTQEAMEPGLD